MELWLRLVGSADLGKCMGGSISSHQKEILSGMKTTTKHSKREDPTQEILHTIKSKTQN